MQIATVPRYICATIFCVSAQKVYTQLCRNSVRKCAKKVQPTCKKCPQFIFIQFLPRQPSEKYSILPQKKFCTRAHVRIEILRSCEVCKCASGHLRIEFLRNCEVRMCALAHWVYVHIRRVPIHIWEVCICASGQFISAHLEFLNHDWDLVVIEFRELV